PAAAQWSEAPAPPAASVRPGPPATSSPVSVMTPAPPAPEAPRKPAGHLAHVRAEPRPTGADAPTPAPVASRTFTLGPTPQKVDVYLDGQRQFAYDPTHTSIAIPWNADHVLELRSRSGCCFVERVDIGPDHAL